MASGVRADSSARCAASARARSAKRTTALSAARTGWTASRAPATGRREASGAIGPAATAGAIAGTPSAIDATTPKMNPARIP